MATTGARKRGRPARVKPEPAEVGAFPGHIEAKRAAPKPREGTTTARTASSTTPSPPLPPSAALAVGGRLVVVDLDTLRGALRELLAEMLSAPEPRDFYSQRCLPPGMTRRAFLAAIRRGDLPARVAGKARFVTRADFEAFIKNGPPVSVRIEQQLPPANDVRALLRAAQGKR